MAQTRNRAPLFEGCLARCYHHLLSYLYVTIFIFGLVVCVLSGLMAWNHSFQTSSYAYRIMRMSQLAENNTLLVFVFVLGLITALTNLVALCGSCLLSKPLLKFYMTSLVILLIIHSSLLIGFARYKPTLETGFNLFMNHTVDNINTQNTSSAEFRVSCDFMDFVSTSFHCCGATSPSDILNPVNVHACCHGLDALNKTLPIKVPGCTRLAIDRVKRSERDYVLLPSSLMILVELIVLGWTWAVTRQIASGSLYY